MTYMIAQHRSTAFVLAELLRMLGDKLPFVRPVAVSNNMGFNVQVCPSVILENLFLTPAHNSTKPS